MKQDLGVLSLYPDKADLSNDNPLRAIVEWDPALPGNLMVSPVGGTAERDDQIRTILKEAFTKL